MASSIKARIVTKNTRKWIMKENFNKTTEYTIIVSQNQALKTNYVKHE